MLRGSGIPWDLRRSQPYEIYKDLDFKIPMVKMRLLRSIPMQNWGNERECQNYFTVH